MLCLRLNLQGVGHCANGTQLSYGIGRACQSGDRRPLCTVYRGPIGCHGRITMQRIRVGVESHERTIHNFRTLCTSGTSDRSIRQADCLRHRNRSDWANSLDSNVQRTLTAFSTSPKSGSVKEELTTDPAIDEWRSEKVVVRDREDGPGGKRRADKFPAADNESLGQREISNGNGYLLEDVDCAPPKSSGTGVPTLHASGESTKNEKLDKVGAASAGDGYAAGGEETEMHKGQDGADKEGEGASASAPRVGLQVGRALLLLVGLLWGAYAVQLRYIYSQPGPPRASVLTLIRKVLAVGFFFSLLPLERKLLNPSDAPASTAEPSDVEPHVGPQDVADRGPLWNLMAGGSSVWVPALELGLYSFLGTGLQAAGLERTTATRAGLEMQLTSILVPLLASLAGERVPPNTWGGACLAVAGLLILVGGSNGGGEGGGGGIADWGGMLAGGGALGDVLVLMAAATFSLGHVRLGSYAKQVPAVQLQLTLMVVASGMTLAWTGGDLVGMAQRGESLQTAWAGWQNAGVVAVIVASALGSAALGGLAQTVGQSVVPPAEAQVLYSLSPVWSTLFATSLLGESVGPNALLGGGLVLCGCLLANVKLR